MSDTTGAEYDRAKLIEGIREQLGKHRRAVSNAEAVRLGTLTCLGDSSCMADHDDDQCAEENYGEECQCTCDCPDEDTARAERQIYATLAQTAASMANTFALLLNHSA